MPDNFVQAHSCKHISRAGNHLILIGSGTWFSIVFQGGGDQRVKIFDGLDNDGTKLASFETSNFVGTVKMETVFKVGLFVKMLSDFDCTIVYYSTVEPPTL